MNQEKWLSDFIYDVESTPLLWSFDDPGQEMLPPNAMKSQSFPKLNIQSMNDPSFQDSTICVSELQETAFQLESEKAVIFSDVAKETSLAKDNVSHGKGMHGSYLDISNGSTSELSYSDYEDEGVETVNTFAGELCSKVPPTHECSRRTMEQPSPKVALVNSPTAPTYLEVQSRECEKISLLREVKKFPSYLAIASPDEETGFDEDKSYAEPNSETVIIDTVEVNTGLKDNADDVGMKEEKVFRRKYSSSSSDTEIVDDVEYLSGGIWYSDEEEERAIQRLCDFENYRVASSESDDNDDSDSNISLSTHHRYKQRTCRENGKDGFNQNRPKSHRDLKVKKLKTTEDKCLLLKNISRELSDDFDESDDDTYNIVNSGQLADIVPFDEVVSLIEDCCSKSEQEENSTSPSCSESEATTSSSLIKSLIKSAGPPCEQNESPIIESECDLEWDTYIPPLSIQWSDVMIKQIFDTVEKDNEKYIRQLRRMAQRQDITPLNILQRLYWYDECSGSLQSLVGVFEYNL